ncbi:MAG: hypothetical protein JRG71_10805 [Deltaproteobacteria bacterium]|nr:hypothetical protein [Deltaproteobacteria bacterium]
MTLLPKINNERGSVLLIGMLLLLVLTMIAVAGMQSTTLENKMSANLYLQNITLQAAEAGLRSGETLLEGSTVPAFNGVDGLYPTPDGEDPPRWQTITWGTNTRNGGTYDNSTGDIAGFTTSAQYFIEDFGTIASSNSLSPDEVKSNSGIYRVTSRGVSISGAEAILQSSFLR